MEEKKKLIKEIIYLAIIYLTHTIYSEGGNYDELMIFLERIMLSPHFCTNRDIDNSQNDYVYLNT